MSADVSEWSDELYGNVRSYAVAGSTDPIEGGGHPDRPARREDRGTPS
jgi:hypothetical protein